MAGGKGSHTSAPAASTVAAVALGATLAAGAAIAIAYPDRPRRAARALTRAFGWATPPGEAAGPSAAAAAAVPLTPGEGPLAPSEGPLWRVPRHLVAAAWEALPRLPPSIWRPQRVADLRDLDRLGAELERGGGAKVRATIELLLLHAIDLSGGGGADVENGEGEDDGDADAEEGAEAAGGDAGKDATARNDGPVANGHSATADGAAAAANCAAVNGHGVAAKGAAGIASSERSSARRRRHALLPAPVASRLLGVRTAKLTGLGLTAVPETLALLTGLRDLDLGDNRLEDVPGGVLASLTGLEALNLAGNRLAAVPPELGALTRLVRLGLRSNRLESLPPELGRLRALRELYLTDNLLESLPDAIGGCVSLVKLQASHNRLEALPASLGDLTRLEMVRVACCRIREVPPELLAAPSLAWLSLGGNPCAGPDAAPRLGGAPSDARAMPDEVDVIAEAAAAVADEVDVVEAAADEVDVVEAAEAAVGLRDDPLSHAHSRAPTPVARWGELDEAGSTALGSGASGEVRSALWHGLTVAVKAFRDDASPDGRVEDELEIACEVRHGNLARVRARLERPAGLLMDVAPGGPMALKPNHASLLRCRWTAGRVFTPASALATARDLAAALEHLHALGVAHGDVYAHNALHDAAPERRGGEGGAPAPAPVSSALPTTTLVDYGASFHYPAGRTREFQGVEARAFGLLVKDLADRIEVEGAEADAARAALHNLERQCLQADVAARPHFSVIRQQLDSQLGALAVA